MADENDPGNGGTKTFTQEELDRHIAERLRRQASQFGDYDALKAKAEKYDADQAKNASDIDKANARADAAERRATDAEAKVLRFEVAADKKVNPRYISGTTREELEAAADQYLTDHPPTQGGEADATKSGGGDTGNGGTGAPSKPSEDLRGGGNPDVQAVETNPAKLAEGVPRF